jgi:hypothetical protein
MATVHLDPDDLRRLDDAGHGRRTGTDLDDGTDAGDVMEGLGRAGLVARGGLYCVAAALVARIASGGNERADKQGALAAVVRQPFGRVLMVALTIGFVGFALWRFARAWTGAREGGKSRQGHKGAARRLADAAKGLLYVGLAFSAGRFALQGEQASSGSGADQREHEWTARLLEAPFGRALVIAVGLGIIGGGAYLALKGLKARFVRGLDQGEMTPRERQWLPRLGIVGYTARGLVFAAIGWFVLQAAWHFDPNEAVGVDGALHRLALNSWGPFVLLVVAGGLLCFGLFSFVEARFRRILED